MSCINVILSNSTSSTDTVNRMFVFCLGPAVRLLFQDSVMPGLLLLASLGTTDIVQVLFMVRCGRGLMSRGVFSSLHC